MNPRRRALLLRPRTVVASGPATEIIRPTSTTLSAGTLTGGATFHAVLSDSSDASYINDSTIVDPKFGNVDSAAWGGALSDLTLAAGRGIASFTATVRSEVSAGTAATRDFSPQNVSTTPAGATFTTGASATDSTVGPFTKSGGGNWTEAQINAMLGQVQAATAPGNTMTARLYDLYVTVTFA